MTYAHDNADRLETVTDGAARVTHFRYDPATSRLARIELPNGTQRVFTYDSAGRVANVRDEVATGGALVSQFTLGYDALDRIVEETTLPEAAQFAVIPAAMSYDDDDRLTAWNALTTESDADGNLTHGPLGGALATFAYAARNRLTSVGNGSYTYDAENRRITRTVSGTTTTFVHDPNAALSRLLQSTTGSTTTRYVYAGSLLLYAETGSALRVHHYDYRGSTVALTDGTGAVLGRVTYGSYGEIVARSGSIATEFLYNGRDGVVTDPNGLYHMRARYYSPETRRFLNADPIGFAGGSNWYAYVGGCPVMSVDPSGWQTAETGVRPASLLVIVQSDVANTIGGVCEGKRVTVIQLVQWTKDGINSELKANNVSIDPAGFRTEGQLYSSVNAGLDSHENVWTLSHGAGGNTIDPGEASGAVDRMSVIDHILQDHPGMTSSDALTRYRALICTTDENDEWVKTRLDVVLNRMRALYKLPPLTDKALTDFILQNGSGKCPAN